MNNTIHFFTCTNVPKAVSYFNSNFDPIKHKIRLSGYPHPVLEKMMYAVCRRAEAESTPVEIIHHCLDNTVQGVILPEKSTGVYGFDVYDPEEPNILADFAGELTKPVLNNLSAAREIFVNARRLHDKQEELYIANTDYAAIDRLTENTIQMLFERAERIGRGKELHRFFGSATIHGNQNYIPEVTGGLQKRYFLKGRPGTGKSTFLKKIAAAAIDWGFDTEIYHCSLDPNSLDLVVVRPLGFCVFDSTAPHEYFPSRGGDEIIDIYQQCVKPGTDEKYQEELASLQNSYKEMVGEGVVMLQKAKKASDRLDAALPALSESQLAELTESVLRQLFFVEF